jgi:hypothetical protein
VRIDDELVYHVVSSWREGDVFLRARARQIRDAGRRRAALAVNSDVPFVVSVTTKQGSYRLLEGEKPYESGARFGPGSYDLTVVRYR